MDITLEWTDIPEGVRWSILMASTRGQQFEHFWCGCKRETTTYRTTLCVMHAQAAGERVET